MSKKIKLKERLHVSLKLLMPDINKGLSYKSTGRKIEVKIDGKVALIYDMNSQRSYRLETRLRTKIEATQYFERNNGEREIDFTQTHIIGQNFIEVVFPKSGKIRRKYISYEDGNCLTLLQPQDFWK